MSLFIANYRRELRMGINLRRKEKIEKAMKFVERMRKMQEEAEVALKKVQEKMKRQADKERKEAEEWKVGDRVMLSTKDLVLKKRLARKLVDWYIGPYTINKVISANVVKLQLPNSMRIHLVVNVSQVVQHKDQVEEQKKEEVKLVEVEGVKEWDVKRILNKKEVKRVVKYLVQQKGLIAYYDSWEKKKNLKNTNSGRVQEKDEYRIQKVG